LKGQKEKIDSQTNIGTVSKATLGKLLKGGVSGAYVDLPERIDATFN